MATIINTLDRTISISKKKTNRKQLLIKIFFAGMAGYCIFLITLAITYSLLFNLLSLGSAQIDGTDFMISSVGFIALATIVYKKGK